MYSILDQDLFLWDYSSFTDIITFLGLIMREANIGLLKCGVCNCARSVFNLSRLKKKLINISTGTIKSFLTTHPSVVGPFAEKQFFTRYYDKGFEHYRAMMPKSTENQVHKTIQVA